MPPEAGRGAQSQAQSRVQAHGGDDCLFLNLKCDEERIQGVKLANTAVKQKFKELVRASYV